MFVLVLVVSFSLHYKMPPPLNQYVYYVLENIDMGFEVEIFRKVNRIKFILKDEKRYKDFLLKFFFRLKDMKNDIFDNNSSNLFNEIYFYI